MLCDVGAPARFPLDKMGNLWHPGGRPREGSAFPPCFPAHGEQILRKLAPLVPMGTSNPHLVRNLSQPGAADPGRILVTGGVLIDREAVDLIGCQGFPLPWADDNF